MALLDYPANPQLIREFQGSHTDQSTRDFSHYETFCLNSRDNTQSVLIKHYTFQQS